jgi:acetyl esterase
MVGKTYYERGEPVVIRAQWKLTAIVNGRKAGGPRNVLIERKDGSQVVRPFRGLRKCKPSRRDDGKSHHLSPRGITL